MKKLAILLPLFVFLFSCGTAEESKNEKKGIKTQVSENETNKDTNETQESITGIIVTDPNDLRQIHAPVPTFIQEIKIKEGQRVGKGQILAYLEHRTLIGIQKDYLQAKALDTRLSEEYTRKKDLFKQQVISKKEFTESESNYLSQKAELMAKKADLEMLGISIARLEAGDLVKRIEIRSKEAGQVNRIWVNAGEFVGEEKPLIELIHEGSYYLKADVFSNLASEIKEGDSLAIHIGNDIVYSLVDRLNPGVDPTRQVLTIYSKKLSKQPIVHPGERVFVDLIKQSF